MVYPFSEDEYRRGIATSKNNDAAGIDNVLVEQLKNLGPKLTSGCLQCPIIASLRTRTNNMEGKKE